MNPDPSQAPIPLPDQEKDALLDLLAGKDLNSTASSYNLSPARLRFLRDSPVYEEIKESHRLDIQDRTQRILTESQLSAAQSLQNALLDDPDLALKFLKETGSLKRAQKEMKQEFDDGGDGTLKIVIDNFGLDQPAQPTTIETTASSEPPTNLPTPTEDSP